MGDETKESKVVAKLEYSQTFNLGNYQSEKISITIEGPFEDIKDGKDLPRLLLFTATNMKKLTDKVHQGVDPKKYEQGSEQVKVEKIDSKKGTKEKKSEPKTEGKPEAKREEDDI